MIADATALLVAARQAYESGRFEAAIELAEEVLRRFPGEVDALVGCGILLQRLGRFDEARTIFERARERDPSALLPYVGILRGHRITDADRPMLESAVEIFFADLNPGDEARQLVYSIAKAYDDLGEFETSILYYDRANRLAAKLQKPNGMERAQHSRNYSEVRRVFSQKLLRSSVPFSNPTRKPIFILGMIRSGTTLVEQIVSRHPDVFAGGEMRFWLENGFSVILPGSPGLNAELAEFLGLEYLSAIQKFAPNANRFTDKMPLNAMLIGLIHLLFPNAPIIHCLRSPVDTCLSIYMTPHAAPPDFAYDRDDIAFAYREYRQIMSHWKGSLPSGRMLEVRYESLVEDPEPNIRRILEYCGLGWDPACLSPERNERAVDTPSKWQVRQPMYRTSVGRAKNYAPWLGAIGELGNE